MKTKIISIFLALVMSLSLCIPTFATSEESQIDFTYEEFKNDVDAHTITFTESESPEVNSILEGNELEEYDEAQKELARIHNMDVIQQTKEFVWSLNLAESGYGYIEDSCIKELDSYVDLEDAQILSYTVYTPKSGSSPSESDLTFLGTYQARDFYTYFPSSLSAKTNIKQDKSHSTLQKWANLALGCLLVFQSVEVNAVWSAFQLLMRAPSDYTIQNGAFTESYCNLNLYTRGVYTKYGNGDYDMVTSQQYAQVYPYMIFHPVDSPKYNEFYGKSYGYQGNVYSRKYKDSSNSLCKEAWQVFNGSLVVDKYDKVTISSFSTVWG